MATLKEAPVAADVLVVALTIRDGELTVLVVPAAHDQGAEHALPRSPMQRGESLPECSARLLATGCGLSSAAAHLEQLGVFDGEPDPRTCRLDIGYLAIGPNLGAATAPAGGQWLPVKDVLHRGQLQDADRRLLTEAVQRAQVNFENSPTALAFCPEEFTIGDLRRIYEAVWDVTLDPGNFHRKVTRIPGFLEATGRTAMRSCGRPGQTFRRGSATRLYPPLLRSEERRG